MVIKNEPEKLLTLKLHIFLALRKSFIKNIIDWVLSLMRLSKMQLSQIRK